MNAHSTGPLPPDRFDKAIEKAISRNPEMRIEYNRSSFCNKIAYLVHRMRSEHRLTQSELATRIGVPQSFISRLENPHAKKEPSIATLVKVMDVFGYKVIIDIKKESEAPDLSLDIKNVNMASG